MENPDPVNRADPPEAPERPAAPRPQPAIALPTRSLLGGTVLAAAAIGALVAAVAAAVRPASVEAAALGALAAAVGTLLGPLALRPWKPRPLDRWPVLLFGGQGLSLLGVLAAAGLVYFAAQPGRVVFALTAAGGFMAALLTQATIFGRAARKAGAVPPSSS